MSAPIEWQPTPQMPFQETLPTAWLNHNLAPASPPTLTELVRLHASAFPRPPGSGTGSPLSDAHTRILQALDAFALDGVTIAPDSWEEGDEMWSFSSPQESWRFHAGRSGFAWVRSGQVIAHVTTLLN